MGQIILLINKLSLILRVISSSLIVAFFIYMVLAVFSQVLGRYLFNFSIAWATETATYSQIWMIFLASGIAMKDKLHVAIDSLFDLCNESIKKFLILIILILGFIFLYMAILGSIDLLKVGQIQTSPALGIKMWIPYLALPIGLSYFSFEFFLFYVNKLWSK